MFRVKEITKFGYKNVKDLEIKIVEKVSKGLIKIKSCEPITHKSLNILKSIVKNIIDCSV